MTTRVFCFDGTTNDWADARPTNVYRLFRGLSTAPQRAYYFPGPGNEVTNGLWRRFSGSAFGAGSEAIVTRAYSRLSAGWRSGDRIAVIGFSRGAGIARRFCAKIDVDGVRGGHPGVIFLGCFDTVHAMLPFGFWQQRSLFYDLHVSPCVAAAAHILALDEDRRAFVPNLMNRRKGVTEVWTRGRHTDIGGGDSDLSDVALQWMIEQLAKAGIVAGVETHPDPSAPIGRSGGWWRRERRRVGVKVNDEWSDEAALILGNGATP
ncbi:MAG: DUF2235 domain-containing protein [Proteobacteria bacterium]|nr:DUF2235 domain-containing protein [Pseudomonadota bacterium]